ncbi:MAG: DUF4163 domain-containing protein, partial [Eubacterium sp.]|nr:DUF4163 domain-containing protein [Eubacterium sp.]
MRKRLYKRKRGYKKISKLALVIMLLVMGMTACGNKETEAGMNSKVEQSEVLENESNMRGDEEALENSNVEKMEGADIGNGENGIGAVPLYPGTHRSSIIQEDDDYLYLCGSCRVSKVDKATGVEQILWENPAEVSEKEENLYSNGGGLLLGNKIYFIERWKEDNWSIGRAFSCINTDGSDYEQLAQLSESFYDSMYLANGTLSINDMDRELFYQVFEDGTLSAPDEIPISNIEELDYQQNGNRILFRQECVNEFGLRIYQDNNFNVCCRNPETEEQYWLPELEGLASYNNQYFLCRNYENGLQLMLYEKSAIIEKYANGQSEMPYIDGKSIISIPDSQWCKVVGMDEEYVYIFRSSSEEESDDESDGTYERISLETGNCEVIFEWEASSFEYTSDIMDEVVLNGYIYYMEERDYIYYLMRRKTDGSGEAEVVLGEGVYDTGIGTVGTVDYYRGNIYSKTDSERLLFETDLSWLVVNENIPGAEAINAVLTGEQDANIARAEVGAEEVEEWGMEEGLGLNYSYSSAFSGFSYCDSKYISFVQSDYEYYGGAHGMPIWYGYTFDLQTGKLLLLSDIVGNTEEELKEIVSGYFAEMINREPENFWENSV